MAVMSIMEKVTWTVVCVMVPSMLALTTAVIVFHRQVGLPCRMLMLTMTLQAGIVPHALGHCHGDARTRATARQRPSLQPVTFVAAVYGQAKRVAVIDTWMRQRRDVTCSGARRDILDSRGNSDSGTGCGHIPDTADMERVCRVGRDGTSGGGVVAWRRMGVWGGMEAGQACRDVEL
jgi:hypothetical protein